MTECAERSERMMTVYDFDLDLASCRSVKSYYRWCLQNIGHGLENQMAQPLVIIIMTFLMGTDAQDPRLVLYLDKRNVIQPPEIVSVITELTELHGRTAQHVPFQYFLWKCKYHAFFQTIWKTSSTGNPGFVNTGPLSVLLHREVTRHKSRPPETKEHSVDHKNWMLLFVKGFRIPKVKEYLYLYVGFQRQNISFLMSQASFQDISFFVTLQHRIPFLSTVNTDKRKPPVLYRIVDFEKNMIEVMSGPLPVSKLDVNSLINQKMLGCKAKPVVVTEPQQPQGQARSTSQIVQMATSKKRKQWECDFLFLS